jgi:hypothetical protein
MSQGRLPALFPSETWAQATLYLVHPAVETMLDPSVFTTHPHPQGFRAIATFPNSYGLSVVPESDGKTYEVAVTCNGKLCYDSGITEDVLRYVTVDSVNDLAVVVGGL